MWARQVVDALRDERRCVVYNLPGHGGSTVATDQPLDLDANAEMLEAFCDALDLDRIDLVANDTGGAIAQAFAVRNPQRLRTLTLTNCEARDVLPSEAPVAELVSTLAEQGQLAPPLKAGYDDREAARQGPLADPYERPDELSDDDLRGIMEPH